MRLSFYSSLCIGWPVVKLPEVSLLLHRLQKPTPLARKLALLTIESPTTPPNPIKKMPQRREAPCLGAPHPYFKTHGTKIARLHLFDWLVLVLLAVMVIVLNIIEPFHRFVGEGVTSNLRYPLKENTVPVWAVPIYAVGGPIVVIIGIYIKRRNAYDLHHAILGLLFSVLMTGVLTDAIKDGVGRPRPNLFWRCFPDGVPRYENITGRVICHGESGVVKEGYKSFPSGHSSWSFAGLGYLSWYLAGKTKAFDRRGHASKLCIVLLPLILAAMVAVSRVSDYWHHWQDVVTGGAIGLVVASFCYLQFFPLPHVTLGWCPHAYAEHIRNYESRPLDHSQGPLAMEMTTTGPTLDTIELGHRAQ